jgi:small conductance mechanosensitive channel
MNDQLRFLDQLTAAAIDATIRFGPKLIVAALIVVGGYYAGRWVGRFLRRGLRKFRLEPPLLSLIERVVHLLVLGLFGIMALQNLGVELLPLIAGLGIAGAGIALAMQGVLGNLVAGLSIIFSQPFRVGDYVSIVEEEGVVLDIDLFNTTLGHTDLSRVVIPNRKIVGEILHNYGRVRQLAIEVGVSYDTDTRAAMDLVADVLRAEPRVLKDPAPVVRVDRLAESCVVIGVKPWVEAGDFVTAAGDVNQAILQAFRAHHIVIPFPQRDIRLVAAKGYSGGEAAQHGLAGGDAA